MHRVILPTLGLQGRFKQYAAVPSLIQYILLPSLLNFLNILICPLNSELTISRPVDTGGRGAMPPNNLPNLFLEML